MKHTINTLKFILASNGDFAGEYYICFGYQNEPSLNDMHITHTYFGECDFVELNKIINVCDEYFKQNPFHKFKVLFNNVDNFGENNDIRVLRPGYPDDDSELWRPDLFQLLMPYNKSEYKNEKYKPHTTTDKPFIDGVIDRICIATGNTILREYRG